MINRPHPLIDSSTEMSDICNQVIDSSSKMIDSSSKVIDSLSKMIAISFKMIDSSSRMIDRESDVSDAESGLASAASVGDVSPVFSPSSPAEPQVASIYWNDRDTSPHNLQQDREACSEKASNREIWIEWVFTRQQPGE